MKRIFEVDPWKVTTHEFSKEDKRLQESITAIGNDYMGMRLSLIHISEPTRQYS